MVVYLPPSYAKEPARRYPVVYFLHGYGVGVETYVGLLRLQEAADKAIADGVREMILVLPDANTVYSGSMYSNSLTTGDWEGFLSQDLVGYIDSHYRTVANQDSRGLRTFDGWLRNDVRGYETSRSVLRALFHERVLFNEQPRPAARCRAAKTSSGQYIYVRSAGTGADTNDVRVVMDFEAPNASEFAWLNSGK